MSVFFNVRRNSCDTSNCLRWTGCDQVLQFPQKVRLLKNGNLIKIVAWNLKHLVSQTILVVDNEGKTLTQSPSEVWMIVNEFPKGDFHSLFC